MENIYVDIACGVLIKTPPTTPVAVDKCTFQEVTVTVCEMNTLMVTDEDGQTTWYQIVGNLCGYSRVELIVGGVSNEQEVKVLG